MAYVREHPELLAELKQKVLVACGLADGQAVPAEVAEEVKE